jgi:uncharacterized protein YfbU (UPF0304 family)
MRMTRAELLILTNQKLIMTTLALMLPKEERLTGLMLTERISHTSREIQEAKTWQED